MFGRGARLGDYNKVGENVVFGDGAVLGVGNEIAQGAKVGTVRLELPAHEHRGEKRFAG